MIVKLKLHLVKRKNRRKTEGTPGRRAQCVQRCKTKAGDRKEPSVTSTSTSCAVIKVVRYCT